MPTMSTSFPTLTFLYSHCALGSGCVYNNAAIIRLFIMMVFGLRGFWNHSFHSRPVRGHATLFCGKDMSCLSSVTNHVGFSLASGCPILCVCVHLVGGNLGCHFHLCPLSRLLNNWTHCLMTELSKNINLKYLKAIYLSKDTCHISCPGDMSALNWLTILFTL